MATFESFLAVADGVDGAPTGSSPSGFARFREVTTTPLSFALALTGRAGFVVADGVGAGGGAVGFTKLGIGGCDEEAAFAATALSQGVSAIRE